MRKNIYLKEYYLAKQGLRKIKEDKKNPSIKKEITFYNLVVPALVAFKLPLNDPFTFNFFFSILPDVFSSNTPLPFL